MTLCEVKTGILKLMQTEFPDDKYNYYAMDVVEGYDRPAFFTQMKPIDNAPVNYNSRKCDVTFYITYMQDDVDELDILDTIQKIEDLFGLSVKIGDRAVKVSNFDWDFIGTDRNIAEISIDLEWMRKISHTENLPLMESAEINQKIMED